MRRGRILGLVGPDGAGKTTLMRLVAGLLAPDRGSIRVLGCDAAREPLRVQALIGYMPQRFGLYEDLSVQENLDLYADLQGVPRRARAERYARLVRMTGLAPFAKRLAGALSGGMKQKLGLACALVRAPRLLVLDEPTVGVDPVSRRELWQIVGELVRDEGASVLLSTAYLDEAERCDEVVLLHEGEVLLNSQPAALGERMRGRTWALRVPGADLRAVQDALAGQEAIADALLQGDSVRLVTREATPPDPGRLPAGAILDSVPPRFEDAFVALLCERRPPGARLTAGTPVSGHPRNGEVVIEARGAQRRYGDFYAVRNVSFEVRRGEIFGLLGANGAGKSTTFRMLCGILPASAGALKVAGVDLRRAASAARERIGYMSQRFSLYANLSVRRNLEFFGGAYGIEPARRAQRRAWALAEFGLEDAVDSLCADLPLGYKQRLALACALMHEPAILFLDEPTSGVDPLARREFWRRINALARDGVTVLVTTHFMEEAEYCDRLAIMEAGEILALGAPVEIKRRVREPGAGEPSMEEAFIRLIEAGARRRAAA
ncbi:MAG: ABC transporter ATP-binding protein [Burkholderiales bacterium]|nr:ABC transporter ATP-binding protein [Burkholderiales bacterium]